MVVDRREDNFDLNDSRVIRNFTISPRPSGAFRFVRLRRIGQNHGTFTSYRIGICALELFGALSGE